jgi:hypothetical protein
VNSSDHVSGPTPAGGCAGATAGAASTTAQTALTTNNRFHHLASTAPLLYPSLLCADDARV